MNYYFVDPSCAQKYIGYCTPGWTFFLCVDEVPDLIAWKEKFKTPGSHIEDYFGNIISPEEMEIIITMRKGNPEYLNLALRCEIGVVEGPHGLVRRVVRRTVPGSKCIANEDCWDLCLTKW